MSVMNPVTRYERWKQKLRYLVANHGGLTAISRAARLKPKSLDQIINSDAEMSEPGAQKLEPATAKQIEAALDLPEGWFDASVFLPSRL